MTLRSDRPDAQRGLALVIVLWIVGLLALMVSAFNVSLRTSLRVESAELEASQRRALLWAAVEITAAHIADPDVVTKWEASDLERTITFADARLRVRIRDHAGRVDLNLADEKFIRGFTQQVAGDARQADLIADRILDWRDPDRDRRPSGAEDGEYRGAGLAYGPADADFQSPEHLVRVLGIDYKQAQRLLPMITVYSRSGRINPEVAPREVLAALPGITPEVVEQILSLRGATVGGALAGYLQPFQQFLDDSKGPVYSIEVTVEREGIASQPMEVVILSSSGSGSSYRVLGFHTFAAPTTMGAKGESGR